MARDFANSAGSPNIDFVTYSGVPPIAGLAKFSLVLRLAGDSNCPNFGTIVNCVNGSNNAGVAIGREALNARLYIAIRNANEGLRTFPFSFDGEYKSVVCTFDGSASPRDQNYVDGVSQTTSGAAVTITSIGTPTLMHLAAPNNQRWNGRLAECAMFNRVLSQAEIDAHAKGVSCLNFPRGMIFYAPMIREVRDIAGGLTGTITGTAVVPHPRIYL